MSMLAQAERELRTPLALDDDAAAAARQAASTRADYRPVSSHCCSRA